MKASPKTINTNNILICMIDEYGSGEKQAFDCNVLSVNDDSVDVLYLSGYKSRNDRVLYEDVVAKVDKRKKRIEKVGGCFSGHFQLFEGAVDVAPSS